MYSMTGYGRGNAESEGRSVTVEIKTVNHRFLDISLKIPRSFTFLEDKIRKQIGETISRGHIELTLTYVNTRSDAKTVVADTALARAYAAALNALKDDLHLSGEISIEQLSAFPDVLAVVEASEDENILAELVSSALAEALKALNIMRLKEGETLKISFSQILDEIEQKSFEVDARYPETVIEFETKLETRLTELIGDAVDEARIAQEVAIMADKAAVNEETVRLRSHLKQAREKLDTAEPCGRSLDFLVQEMNREVNTISSKSQDIPITKAVLVCKNAIEKLREQIQNIE